MLQYFFIFHVFAFFAYGGTQIGFSKKTGGPRSSL
ncbi:hypothetical protein NEOC95_001379 [Neochlamydia sp. AcF95]|nr:hypothetical protein [Neochlamydia sp. AcF95]